MTDIKTIGNGWTASRLDDVRNGLRQSGFDGFIIPRWDCHQFEYAAPWDERLAWATGFTGSWGMAIITLDRAAIFIDGRYTEQAQREVDTGLFDHEHLYDAPPQNWLR